MRSCCVFDSLRLLHFPLLAVYLLSYRPVFPPGHQLHLPRCGGQIPCALQLLRTLAPLPSTTLSHERALLMREVTSDREGEGKHEKTQENEGQQQRRRSLVKGKKTKGKKDGNGKAQERNAN